MFRRILVPIDGSPTSQRGLEEAIALASDQKATICLLHVLDDMGATPGFYGVTFAPPSYVERFLRALREQGKKLLDRAAARVQQRGIAVETVLLETLGRPTADAIVKQAKKWRADVIVLGTHGRRGLSRVVLGSDAEMVVRETLLPVLLVRSPLRARKPRAQRS